MLLKLTRWIAATVVFLAVATSAQANDANTQPYKVLPQPVPVLADGKIHVEEAFWYGCPHCFSLEDYVSPWKKNLASDVSFTGVPAMFGRAWVAHAQLYYVADSLNVLDKAHSAIFRAVNVDRVQLLSREDQRAFLVAKTGVTAEAFDKAYDSFTVKSRMKQGDQRIRAFGINGVPAIIVQGKYVVDAASAGGQHNITKVVDHLIAIEREAMKKR